MTNRHTKIGFKQIIRLEWLNKTLNMVLAGYSEKEIRESLDTYISTQMQRGGEGAKRNRATYGMSVVLLSCWFRKEPELQGFRADLLEIAKKTDQSQWLPLHMALVCAAYPFFGVVCGQIGRIFNLQEKITSKQIYSRIADMYGEKTSVLRNTRFIIRTLVSWGLIKEVNEGSKDGLYIKGKSFEVIDQRTISLLLEGVLLSLPDERSEFYSLLNHDSLFYFLFEPITSGMLCSFSKHRIESLTYSLNSEFVQIVK